MASKKVCVVGAGVSGLVSARELRREGHDVRVMEQSADVAGQWLYDPRTDGGDPLGLAGVHSSIYASLRLIIPREVMSFSDMPFYPRDGGDGRRYPGHGEFLRYIRDFCDAFGLMDAVRLNTTVLRVAMAADGSSPRWTVRSCTRRRGEDDAVVTEEVFDAVVVAVGQYTQPRLPAINGMDKWGRRQLHSHSYRVPGPFHGEVVVIVGCHESGKDIALDLCKVAMEVHISVKSVGDVAPGVPKAVWRHRNLHLHPQIDCLREDGTVVFADGSRLVADSVIYCTGYRYSFPFLDAGGAITVDEDNRVGPLFEHTFPPALAPELSFVGLPKKVVLPWFYEVQARWVAQVLSGRRTLPPVEEMLRSVVEYNRDREAAGVPKRLTHDLYDLEYCEAFGEKHCAFPRLPEWKKELVCSSIRNMHEDHENFRDHYKDSDLVRDGLRSHGWLPVPGPRTLQQDDGGDDVSKTQPKPQTTRA